MSHSSKPADQLSIPSPAVLARQNPAYQTPGASAESSRPSTASAVKAEVYGGSYGGSAPARPVIDAGIVGPSSRRQSAESSAQTPSRPLGMHSILNPSAEPEGERELASARSIDQLTAMNIGQGLLPMPAESPQSRKRPDPRSPPPEQQDNQAAARPGRRVLTPKSPSMRAGSLGARRTPTFHSTVHSLQPKPGASRRTYTAEPGLYRSSQVPPLPPLSIATGPPLTNLAPFDQGAQPRSAHVSENPVRGFDAIVTPHTERSSASQTPYGKVEQSSPPYRYGSGQPLSQGLPSAFQVLPAAGGGLFSHETQLHGPHEGYQAGPASYQMTLDTEQGPMVVPVELDLQQASKVADEKRKRNAGASARFRARRKEKEKEASSTISGLHQEVRDLMEERDFYLSERNYFRDLASRQGSSAQLLQRPSSPRLQRLRHGGSSESAPVSDDSYREMSESGQTTQRRRTGDYQPAFIGAQMHSPPVGVHGAGFASQPPLPLPPPPSGLSAYGGSRTLPPGPSQPPITRTRSYDPFHRDPFEKNWSSGR